MSNISFENFANLGKKFLSLASGRSGWMKSKLKFIVKDISLKLILSKSDDVLDVGCGDARILNQIKPLVKSVTGIDHHLIIKKLKKNIKKLNLLVEILKRIIQK